MKYYVVADIHGYYTELIKSLTEKGWFDDNGPKKLIVCGDMMDRGQEAQNVQKFMIDLLEKDELIFIRGNHEDLMLCMLDDIIDDFAPFMSFNSYHVRNGTLGTAAQLNNFDVSDFLTRPKDFVFKARHTQFVKDLIPVSVNYFETEHYIFVHGWIPCKENTSYGYKSYVYDPDWRNASDEMWNRARWINGMKAACIDNVIEPNKTIVCGHWHASYGHATVDKKCSEFGNDAIFDPYYNEGIIAMDTCTAHTRRVNCIVIED